MTNTVSHLCGFADTTNTGVPAGTTLTTITNATTGPNSSDGSGWTADDGLITLNAGGVLKDVYLPANVDNGSVDVVGDNATIEDSDIVAPGGWAVQTRHVDNTTILHNTLQGGNDTTAGDGCDSGVRDIYNDSEDFDVQYNNIYWCAAPINNISGGGTFSNNYIHDFWWSDTAEDNHFDGMQFEDPGAATTISNNTILMDEDQTSPMILSNDEGTVEMDRTINHNLLAGGDYCFYGSGGPSEQAKNITFTNNDLSPMYWNGSESSGGVCGYYGTDTYFNTGNGDVWSGNYLDTTGATQEP